MTAAPRIVAFMPFAATTDEVVARILNALTLRGSVVTPVLCDGLFSACELYLGPGSRPADACLLCQAHAAGRLAAWKMPFRWLGRWLSPDATQKAGAWVAGLKPQDHATAAAGDWRLGDWAADSAARQLHTESAPSKATAAMIAGSHLFSAHLAASALERLFEDVRPDAMILMEGRSALARTAAGIAQLHNIRAHVVTPTDDDVDAVCAAITSARGSG